MLRSRIAVPLIALALLHVAGCPAIIENQETLVAHLVTGEGEIQVELFDDLAPFTVENFTQYADDDFYDGTVFHRVVAGEIIQGGGLTPDLAAKETRAPILNESDNGLTNARGTISMARTAEPHSATAQFFINLQDNPELDARFGGAGYAVFGIVIAGLDVVDRIGALPTASRDGFADVPDPLVVIQDVWIETRSQPTLTEYGEYYIEYEQFQVESLINTILRTFLIFGIGSLT